MIEPSAQKLDTEELRALLRRGDPAADGSQPDGAEVAALRRTVLAEARRQPTRRSPYLRPARALAAAAVTVVGLAIWQLGLPGFEPADPTPPPAHSNDSAASAPGSLATAPGTTSSDRSELADPTAPARSSPPVSTAGPTRESSADPQSAAVAGATAPVDRPGGAHDATLVAGAAEHDRPRAIEDDPTAANTATTPAAGTAVAEAGPEAGLTTADERRQRVVHFTTPGGTRVVWTLKPDFELPSVRSDGRQGDEPR